MARAAAAARRSVVVVRALGKKRDGYGAGVIVRADGLVLTARHVIAGATAIAVELGDDEWPAEVVATDRGADLALVRIVAHEITFSPVCWADEGELQTGETVLTIGNAFGLGLSVSRGILSARDRRGVVPDNEALLLQTDAAVNPGSSGGPLLNLDGRVIGIVTAILTRTGGHQGVAFAVPASEVRRALPDLVAARPVRRPWLGVRLASTPAGLRITGITPGGPAARANLRTGDLIVASGSTSLRKTGQLRRVLADVRAGERISLRIRRDDKSLSLELETSYRGAE